VVIGLPSSGVHSNGFSLVRKVFDVENADLRTPLSELDGRSLGETLLTPTKIYVKPMLKLMEKVNVRSVAHITGGGFYENIPRSIPDGFQARIDKKTLRIPPIFKLLQAKGDIPERDMFNTFNMGVGMTVVVPRMQALEALDILRDAGEDAYIIGEILPTDTDEKVVLI
jgi:phosphoribosylformylglycinamidine cyclo-ligase